MKWKQRLFRYNGTWQCIGQIRQQLNSLCWSWRVRRKRKDLSDFCKGHIVMPRQLGHSISTTAVLVGSSQSALIRINKKWSKKGKAANRLGQGSLGHVGSEGLWIQIPMKSHYRLNSRKSSLLVLSDLLRMGLSSHRLVRVLMLTHVHCWEHRQMSMWASELDHGAMKENKLVWYLTFCYIMSMAGSWERNDTRMHCRKNASRCGQSDALGIDLAGKPWVLRFLWMLL